MSDGISGKDFYIPALHEVLRLESSTLLNDLKDSVGTRKWELLATRLGFQANYYTNRHKQRRWIAIDSISKSNSTPPFSPLNLVDGKCAGQALKLPKWVESSCSRNIVEILKRIEHSEDNEIEKCNDNSENANTNQPSISRNQHHDICFVSPSKEIEISEQCSVCETPINCEMNECAMDTTMANSGANIKSPYDQNRKISFVSPNAPMFCKGLKRKVNEFAEMSLANKGYCLELFTYNKRRKVWTSDDCFEVVDIEGSQRCMQHIPTSTHTCDNEGLVKKVSYLMK